MMIVFFSYVFTDIGDDSSYIYKWNKELGIKIIIFPLFKGGSQSGCQATEYEPG